MQKTIKITTEFVTLGQALKIADLIDSGGQAKAFLVENTVFVNKEKENRRGRKIYPEFTIKTKECSIVVKKA